MIEFDASYQSLSSAPSAKQGINPACARSGPTDARHRTSNLFSRQLLDRRYAYELLVEQEIVKNLQRTREEEGEIDPGCSREHEPYK